MEMLKDKRPETVSQETEQDILADLEKYLEAQDLVILIDENHSEYLTELFCKSETVSKTKKNLAIISTAECPKQTEKHRYRKASKEEMDILLRLFRSYEASDRLLLFSDTLNYGSLWNYVKSGLIDYEEMIGAMLAQGMYG